MRKLKVTTTLVLSLFVIASQGHSILKDRGNGLIYDTELNITWLQNVNVKGSGSNWADAMAWVNDFEYEGFDDWRLPTSPVTAQGFINEGELGHLYYTTLANSIGGPLSNTGPFENMPHIEIFWLSSTPLHSGSAWNFEFYRGFQNASSSVFNSWYAWPVRDGDSSCRHRDSSCRHRVPDTGATVALLSLTLTGLIFVRRRMA